MTNNFDDFCSRASEQLRQHHRDLLGGGFDKLKDTPATWHPNGFVVFKLMELRLGELRLHIWPRNSRTLRSASTHVHTHVWDLCSLVLVGTYSERLFQVDDELAGTPFSSALIDYQTDPDTLRQGRQAFLRPGPVTDTKAGEIHVVQAGVPHETLIPATDLVATLLLTSRQRLTQAEVFFQGEAPRAEYERPLVDVQERHELVRQLQAHVGGLP